MLFRSQTAAVDKTKGEEKRDGYAEVAGAVSEDGRVGGAGDQVYQGWRKRCDTDNQSDGNAEAE